MRAEGVVYIAVWEWLSILHVEIPRRVCTSSYVE